MGGSNVVNKMFTVCIGSVFGSMYVTFAHFSIHVNTVEVDPYSSSLENGIMKPKNCYLKSRLISLEIVL